MGLGRFPANEARNEIPNPIGTSIGPVRAGHCPVRRYPQHEIFAEPLLHRNEDQKQ
jgi:hypothetical protein